MGTVEVAGGEYPSVEILAEESFSYALTEHEKPLTVISGTGFVYAPVAQGQSAGFAYICLDGRPIGKVSLVYGQGIELERVEEPSLLERLFGGKKS